MYSVEKRSLLKNVLHGFYQYIAKQFSAVVQAKIFPSLRIKKKNSKLVLLALLKTTANIIFKLCKFNKGIKW